MNHWKKGRAPVAVIMISLNEAHNIQGVLDNLSGWASEVFLVDSHSTDDTVQVAKSQGVHVVLRKFEGFGSQWNFAVTSLPVTCPWVMKLDPDERLSEELKASLIELMQDGAINHVSVHRRLWFMGRPLNVSQSLLRLWRAGTCRFSVVEVNEYPIVPGVGAHAHGYLDHHDSPSLEHWVAKQNKYTTAEAKNLLAGIYAFPPRLFGSSLERRMWFKRVFFQVPGRYMFCFLYFYLFLGAWRAGIPGYCWARLRVEVMRMIEFKALEMKWAASER